MQGSCRARQLHSTQLVRGCWNPSNPGCVMYCYKGAGLFMSTFTLSGKIPGRPGEEFSKFRQKSFFKGKRQLLVFSLVLCLLKRSANTAAVSVMSAACLLTTLAPPKWHTEKQHEDNCGVGLRGPLPITPSGRRWLLYHYHRAGGGYCHRQARISGQAGCKVLVHTMATVSQARVYPLLPARFLCSNSIRPYIDGLYGKGCSPFTTTTIIFTP